MPSPCQIYTTETEPASFSALTFRCRPEQQSFQSACSHFDKLALKIWRFHVTQILPLLMTVRFFFGPRVAAVVMLLYSFCQLRFPTLSNCPHPQFCRHYSDPVIFILPSLSHSVSLPSSELVAILSFSLSGWYTIILFPISTSSWIFRVPSKVSICFTGVYRLWGSVFSLLLFKTQLLLCWFISLKVKILSKHSTSHTPLHLARICHCTVRKRIILFPLLILYICSLTKMWTASKVYWKRHNMNTLHKSYSINWFAC